MRNINSTVLANLRSEEYAPAILLNIDVTDIGIFYLTSWSQMVSYGGHSYYPRGMRFDSIRYGSYTIVDSVNLTVDDVDRALYAAFAERGSEPFPTNVILVVLNSVGQILGATTIFTGTVSEWNYQPGNMKFKVASVLEQWSRVSTSLFSGSCRWKIFKGTECQYSGPESECDRTYSQCDEYGNTSNYGGFRWIQSLEGKMYMPGGQST